MSAQVPWHWMAGQDLPMDSLFELSSCQHLLAREQPVALRLLDEHADGMAAFESAAQAAGVAPSVRRWLSKRSSRLTFSFRANPPVHRSFARMGLTWWCSVLATHMISVREPLVSVLQAYPPWARLSADFDRRWATTRRGNKRTRAALTSCFGVAAS